VEEGVLPTLGEAHLRGPVVLSWDAVRRAGRHPETGHNLVIHEFAHKLDMLDGYADGVPPLGDASEYGHWREVCDQEYDRLVRRAERGESTLLDPYGSLDPAEFFSVVTEAFFDHPIALKEEHPELYEVFSRFFRQDTAERERRARGGAAE
jgi:Mlc titration factor MtfA (ptsG expression regulator)